MILINTKNSVRKNIYINIEADKDHCFAQCAHRCPSWSKGDDLSSSGCCLAGSNPALCIFNLINSNGFD